MEHKKIDKHRQFLIKVYQDTVYHSISPQNKNDIIPNLISYDNIRLQNVKPKAKYDGTKLIVENTDSFSLSKYLIDNGITTSEKILTLNMASHIHSGGGVANGARAQEECLFRSSNYFLHLPQAIYPLNDDELILSRNVKVFKDAMDGYKYITPFYVNCVAVAALCDPKTQYLMNNHNETYTLDSDREIMRTKIRDIFKIAYLNKYDTLVLGALGCGAFGNPAEEVAKLYLDTIREFKGCFKTIAFAVLSGHDNPNYDIFENLKDAYEQS